MTMLVLLMPRCASSTSSGLVESETLYGTCVDLVSLLCDKVNVLPCDCRVQSRLCVRSCNRNRFPCEVPFQEGWLI